VHERTHPDPDDATAHPVQDPPKLPGGISQEEPPLHWHWANPNCWTMMLLGVEDSSL
jgi:hypothetical protein